MLIRVSVTGGNISGETVCTPSHFPTQFSVYDTFTSLVYFSDNEKMTDDEEALLFNDSSPRMERRQAKKAVGRDAQAVCKKFLFLFGSLSC